MKKVFQLLRCEPVEGEYGLEIEAEGKKMDEVHNKYWRTEDDGSLRGRYPESRAEFVLNKPIPRDEVKAAVNLLLNDLEGAEFDFSFRTSVHVHMNVQQLTYPQLLNVIYTYLLLEEPLTTYCGKERKGNRFCLRLSDAEGMLDSIKLLFQGEGREMLDIPHDEIRYSAINLEALRKYGSVEFRAMRGNADPEVIDTWVGALDSIKKYAMGKADPLEIYNDFEQSSPSAFLKQVLGDYAMAFIYPRLIRDVQRSYSLSLDLPHVYAAAKANREEAAKRPKPKAPDMAELKFPKVAHPFGDALDPRMVELMRRAFEEQQARQARGEWN